MWCGRRTLKDETTAQVESSRPEDGTWRSRFAAVKSKVCWCPVSAADPAEVSNQKSAATQRSAQWIERCCRTVR